MEEKDKQSLFTWIKNHKKQLIIAGVSITAIVLAVLAIKNKSELMKLWGELEEALKGLAKVTDKISNSNIAPQVKIDEAAEITEVITTPKLIVVDSTTIDKIPFEVQKHVRNLHPGYHPSPEKIATALENGIQLLPNQTWVKDYTKGLAVAA